MQGNSIIDYYNELAKDYDNDRFNNSYGNFIDTQERKLLQRILQPVKEDILDLGCGTGRLMEFATHGVDGSTGMLEMAKYKFPGKDLHCSDIALLPFKDNMFNAVFSFHVFMHLEPAKAISIFNEVERVLKPGGLFIFDFPSAKRREIIKTGTTGWHGNTAYDITYLRKELAAGFNYKDYYGIMLLPIQRIPKRLRKYFTCFDRLLCKGFKKYASYNIAVFVKN